MNAVQTADIRTGLAAWLATVLAASSLLPLIDGTDWLVQAALLLLAQSGAAALLRHSPLPSGLVALCQLGVGLLLLTMASAGEYALAGVVPTPEVFERFGQLLTAGGDDIGRYTTPAPATDGIRLMVWGGVLLVGLLVDLLAVPLRNAAAAGLPLLALFSVAAGVGQEATGWPYFAAAGLGYLVLLLSEGGERLSHWGLFYGGPGGGRWMTARDLSHAARPRARAGRRIGALTLGVALLTPLLLPGLGNGLLNMDEPESAGAGSGGLVSVDPVVALKDQLNQPENIRLLTYRADGAPPREMYLRLTALDEFDGAEWSSSNWRQAEVPQPPWPVTGLGGDVEFTNAVTEIRASDAYAQRSLPVPYPATSVTANGPWAFDRGSQTLVSESPSLTSSGQTYQVEHLVVSPTREQLAEAPEADDSFREYYTRVPEELPREVRETALEVTAGSANPYEEAVALQDWFTQSGGFRYDTRVESGTGTEAIVNFLEQKEGFCVHFAFTMAAMARSLGIPAQVAVGFTPGSRTASGEYEVGAHNAHAWPELYFEGVGWVRFEPTPGQGNAPEYTQPERPDNERPAEPEPTEPTESGEPTPSASSTAPERCDPAVDGACRQEPTTPEQDRDESGFPLWPTLWGGGGLLLLLLLATPLLWRARARARRLAPEAGPLGAWRELTDSAWDFGILPQASETPRQAAERIVRVARLDETAAAAVRELATAVEAELFAPSPAPAAPAGVGAGGAGAAPAPAGEPESRSGWRRQIALARAGLAAGLPRLARLRALLLPRSAGRVIPRRA
ncbi:transglutaminaseTgpA domain-containing protein [Streptomyces triticirhizae]|uniref:DUF4129 domain-containing protein n=1 Tax=Streptomyces triticirhizae TaxID=2483353 RepID=A0A3M2KXH9_9ACTN|nr:transglutaminaseTgpA domain-containing protein [Streptomyces triticirhizae]RMI29774.1 DUF4129 domain-containing protein [Streptomyces triticirhizae]